MLFISWPSVVQTHFQKKMTCKHYLFAVVLFFFLAPPPSFGQNNRLNTSNQIGWYTYFGTFKLSNKLGLHTEYQFRRNEVISYWQQSLLRIGLNYSLHPSVQVRVGYGWIETFAYGEYSLNGFGKQFTEHRIFQMAQLSQKVGKVDFSHAVYDEVFVGFGQHVNANVFDQNRIGVLLGYRFSKNFRLYGGYLNQTLPYGRLINGKNGFQHNNGLIINSNFTLDLTKKQGN